MAALFLVAVCVVVMDAFFFCSAVSTFLLPQARWYRRAAIVLTFSAISSVIFSLLGYFGVPELPEGQGANLFEVASYLTLTIAMLSIIWVMRWFFKMRVKGARMVLKLMAIVACIFGLMMNVLMLKGLIWLTAHQK